MGTTPSKPYRILILTWKGHLQIEASNHAYNRVLGLLAALKVENTQVTWRLGERFNLASFVQRNEWKKYDGLYIASRLPDDFRLLPPGFPCVSEHFFERSPELVTCRHDDEAAAGILVDHLVKEGHRLIGFVNPYGASYARLRFEGYSKAMKRHGLPVRPAWVSGIDLVRANDTGELHERRTRTQMKHQIKDIASALFDRRPYPTALLCVSDACAFGLWEEAQRRGRRVPEDLALVGFNDAFEQDGSTWSTRELTSIRQDGYLAGFQGMRLLFDLIEGRQPMKNQKRLTPGRLMVRRSSLKKSLTLQDADLLFKNRTEELLAAYFSQAKPDRLIARGLGIGGKHFRLRYRQVFGRRWSDGLAEHRMQKAGFAIRHTRQPILEILTDVGFQNPASFYSYFQKIFGVSPLSYRQAVARKIGPGPPVELQK